MPQTSGFFPVVPEPVQGASTMIRSNPDSGTRGRCRPSWCMTATELEPCLWTLVTSMLTLEFTTSFARTRPLWPKCSAIWVVLEPGDAHMSSTTWPGPAPSASTGSIDDASCRVSRPVSCSAMRTALTSPCAEPRSNGSAHALPGPLNQVMRCEPMPSSQPSVQSLSALRGLTRTVSGSLSKEPLNQPAASSLQWETARSRTLS